MADLAGMVMGVRVIRMIQQPRSRLLFAWLALLLPAAAAPAWAQDPAVPLPANAVQGLYVREHTNTWGDFLPDFTPLIPRTRAISPRPKVIDEPVIAFLLGGRQRLFKSLFATAGIGVGLTDASGDLFVTAGLDTYF